MKTFLQLVAQDLYCKIGNDLSRTAIIFPNKRASLFFNEHLANQSDQPLWSPAYLSISELFQHLSVLKLGDPIRLVCELYKIFREETNSDESLDDFYFWGELLISDFDDVDKNLVHADKLFTNLQDLKNVMDDYEFLDQEQEQAIQQFFQNFSIEKRTLLKEKFISLWDKLGDIYHRYHKKLEEFNAKPFQKKKGSRLSAFLEEERDFLMPLPASPYETAVWSTATIQPDYLITVGDCRYSVPYEFIGKKVDIRTTENSIEIFYHNHRIASHVRKMHSAEPVYILEHMPENHRRFLEYNTESFLDWGKNMGHSTLLVVKHFLYMHKVEQQGYKSCASLMKLADRYGTERLENACAKALSYTPSPSLKNISTILKNGQDKVALTTDPVRASSKESSKYGITRGASYYGGGDRS